jgi:hypothetical protein
VVREHNPNPIFDYYSGSARAAVPPGTLAAVQSLKMNEPILQGTPDRLQFNSAAPDLVFRRSSDDENSEEDSDGWFDSSDSDSEEDEDRREQFFPPGSKRSRPASSRPAKHGPENTAKPTFSGHKQRRVVFESEKPPTIRTYAQPMMDCVRARRVKAADRPPSTPIEISSNPSPSPS